MDKISFGKSFAAAMLSACAITMVSRIQAADVAPVQPLAPTQHDDGQSVAQQISAMRIEFARKQQEAFAAYAAATDKSNEERVKIYQEKSPNPLLYAQKALNLAKDDPKNPGAVDALLFVLQLTRGDSPDYQHLDDEAIAQLSRDHLDDPKISGAFSKFMYMPSDAGTQLMHLASEKSSNSEVRGSALFWLAQSIKTSAERSGDEKQMAEAKKLYEQVADQYAGVALGNRTLGEQAKTNLFEMENLAIGKPAPEIEGKDADRKPLKLSDYKGKVVVLDFWGNW